MDSFTYAVNRRRVWLTSAVASLGGFVTGYNIGIVGALLPENVMHYYQLSDATYEIYHWTPFLPLGAVLGSLTCSWLSEQYGRRMMFLVYDLIVLLGCIVVPIPYFPLFLLARFLAGVASGGMMCLAVHYIRETIPSSYFARVSPLIQLQLAVGIFTADLLAMLVSFANSPKLWLLMYEFQCIAALVQLGFFLKVLRLETPYYCWKRNWKREAHEALFNIYLDASESVLIEEVAPADGVSMVKLGGSYFAFGAEETYRDLLCCRNKTGKLLRGGILINVFQQAVGINGVLFYINSVPAGNGVNQAITVFGLAKMLAMLSTFYLNRRFKRIYLLSVGNLGVAVVMLVLAFVYHEPGGFWILIFYLAFYEIGIGQICWIYCGETLSLTATSLVFAINWVCTSIVVVSYVAGTSDDEDDQSFYMPLYLGYAAIAVLSVIYFNVDLIETKGKPPFIIYHEVRNLRP